MAIITSIMLVNGLCKIGDTSGALECLKKMVKRNLGPNVVVYNAILDGLCKRGLVGEALGLLHEMGVVNVEPNVVTYNCLIQGLCGEFGGWREGVGLFNEMVAEKGIVPDVQTFSILVNGFCKEGLLLRAESMVGFIMMLCDLCMLKMLMENW